MKVGKALSVAVLVAGVSSSTVQAAPVQTIADTYVGGTPTHSSWAGKDVIGDSAHFDINQMTVDLVGSVLSVQIHSTYFDNVGQLGTQLGDLFISSNGWTPFGAAPYLNDTAANGEDWEYVFVMDDHGEAFGNNPTSMIGESGSFNVYSVNEAQIIQSFAPAGYIFRGGQEVQYDAGTQTAAAQGSWSIFENGQYDVLQFTFDLSSLALTSGGQLGLHWTFSCGNDVIEGSAAVPEPASLALLGASVLGAGLRRRRR